MDNHVYCFLSFWDSFEDFIDSPLSFFFVLYHNTTLYTPHTSHLTQESLRAASTTLQSWEAPCKASSEKLEEEVPNTPYHTIPI